MSARDQADVLLVGGGLANSLIALRLKALQPALNVVMLERAAARDEAHTWSCFDTDVSAEVLAWLKPLRCASWSDYDVVFPGHSRTLGTGYGSILGDDLGFAVEAALGPDLHRGVTVTVVTPDSASVEDGRTFSAPLVIDGRGARASRHLSLAWQKFVGLEFELEAPHGLTRPTVMDASAPQIDGYRFFYLLPFGPDRLLVEDTRYSNGDALDEAALEREVTDYATAHGWRVKRILRRETGRLPLALGGDIEAFWAEAPAGVPQVGMRAALFHPVTGYASPDAASLADEIAHAPDLTSAAIDALVRARSKAAWRSRGYMRMLNRMMFLAAEPERRYRVLERFYRLSQPLVERFYASRSTWADKARILAGEPPVPIGAALRALPSSAAQSASKAAA